MRKIFCCHGYTAASLVTSQAPLTALWSYGCSIQPENLQTNNHFFFLQFRAFQSSLSLDAFEGGMEVSTWALVACWPITSSGHSRGEAAGPWGLLCSYPGSVRRQNSPQLGVRWQNSPRMWTFFFFCFESPTHNFFFLLAQIMESQQDFQRPVRYWRIPSCRLSLGSCWQLA